MSQTIDTVVAKHQCLPEKQRFPVVKVPAWVRCTCCDDFLCAVHGGHVYDCACPSIEEWADAGMFPYEPCLLRYLTCRECERLQGMPDDWTLIDWRGKLAPDGPRYRAIGNSMAVPVMRWIGRRIDATAKEDR